MDWGKWLGEAKGRYDVFLERHGGQDIALDPESAEKRGDEVEAEHPGAGQDGDDERELVGALSEGSASIEVGTSECGSDDECRNASEKKESLAAAWGRALGRLRGRGGGMTTAERRQQRRLEGKERPKEQLAPGPRGGGGVVGDAAAGGGTGPDESRETRVLFTCDMLLREERTRKDKDGKLVSDWISMTCGDPDDFQMLKERRWSTETEFKADDQVILWRTDASAPPDGQKGYVRSGKVVKVVLAGEVVDDPEIRRYDLRGS